LVAELEGSFIRLPALLLRWRALVVVVLWRKSSLSLKRYRCLKIHGSKMIPGGGVRGIPMERMLLMVLHLG